MRYVVIGYAALTIAAIGCGKGAEGSAAQQASATASAPHAAPPPPASATQAAVQPAPAKPTAELKIASVGNTMAYDLTSMTVSAGQPVHLVLKNNSNMEVMPHNWVLVKTGTEASVAAAGLKAGPAANYIQEPSEDILAHTPLAPKGQSTEVTFTAPAAGSYPYICTVPGHYMKMKGVLTVTP